MDEAESDVVVPASPEETWDALTDPERLADWLGEPTELDLRPGGDIAIRVGDEERHGFVEEVSEPSRLVFWWNREDEEASRVEIELEPEVDGTRVRVTESRPLRVLDLPGIELETRIGGGGSPQMSARPLALAG